MNKTILIKSLGIILLATILAYTSTKFNGASTIYKELFFILIVTAFWFFLLKQDVSLSFKRPDKYTLHMTLPLLGLIFSISLFIFVTSDTINTEQIISILIISLLIGIFEEIVFRGIGLGSFVSSGITPFNSILFSSILFSIFHLGSIMTDMGVIVIFQLINIFMMGIIFGYIYYATKNILYVILIHFLWDFAIFNNQQFSSNEIGSTISIILFAVTVGYFIWSMQQTIYLRKTQQ